MCRWEPEGNPCGVVQIVHGIAEHVQRYEDFAHYLNSFGYLVVAEDHMGHGKSIGVNGKPGYFHGGWFSAVEDTYHLLTATKEEFPEIPYILLGHSMGSFIARTILQKHPDSQIDGCILCGTGWMPEAKLRAGILTAKTVCRHRDESLPSAMLQSIAFGGYNRRVEHRRTKFDWLSRNGAAVDAYIADPLCGFDASAGLMRDMLSGILYIQQRDNLMKMHKNLPIHFISGDCDPVGNYGAGVAKAIREFKSCGMKKVSYKMYPLCRHELLNEISNSEVYEDIQKWIHKITEARE